MSEWALPEVSFRAGIVGAKSLGVARLATLAMAGGEFVVPPAFALPFGTFERVLLESPMEVLEDFATAM